MNKDWIPWNDDLKIGIFIIDEEHRRLVAILNDLYRDTHSDDCEGLSKLGILTRLENYTGTHFTVEEELMEVYKYPTMARQAHILAHQDFCERLRSLRESASDGALDLPESLMSYLKKWLQDHILKTDRALSVYLSTKGLP